MGAILTSKTQQTLNDGEKGQTTAFIKVRLKGCSSVPDKKIIYSGQEYTGITLLVPEFYYEISGEKRVITQGVPEHYAFPSEVVETWRAAVIVGEQLSTKWPDLIEDQLALVLRRIVTTIAPVPLFGIATETNWTYTTANNR